MELTQISFSRHKFSNIEDTNYSEGSMTVSIVANGFLRNSPIFPLQQPAESSTTRPSACCTLNPAHQRNARDRPLTQSRIQRPEYNERSPARAKPSLQLQKATQP